MSRCNRHILFQFLIAVFVAIIGGVCRAENIVSCYGGDVSAAEWTQRRPGHDKGMNAGSYAYGYDALDRLTEAQYGGDGERDFTCRYGYDAMGNATRIQWSGISSRVATGGETHKFYGVVDDLLLAYEGNLLVSADDEAEPTAHYGATDFRDGVKDDTEYRYDANGNMTRDLNRGIDEITYDRNNRPMSVRFLDGRSTEYVYDSDGQKLRVSHYGAGGDLLSQTDYIGDCVLRDGKLWRTLLPTGYMENDTVYTFVRDLQGNVRLVVREDGEVVESNEYYPYGMPFDTSRSVQPYKYGGKELDRTHGLDWYDSQARHYDPTTLRTTTQDPLAELNYNYSPYAWCFANPIRFSDPDGRFPIDTAWDLGNLLYDVGVAIYHHAVGEHDKAIDNWTDAGADAVATIIPYVPAGSTKILKAGGKIVDGGNTFNKNIKAGKEFEKSEVRRITSQGGKFSTQSRLVPKNGKGNVKGNRTNVDLLQKNDDGTFTIYEFKLSDKSGLSKGQKAAKDHVENGNGKFEVRSKNVPDTNKSETIEVTDYVIIYKNQR